MFTGFINESGIDVYALSMGRYENINYHIVDAINDIESVQIAGVGCTSFEQTMHDMLADLANTDEWALTEALSYYFYSNNNSFSGLNIFSKSKSAFESIMQSAIEYYNEG